MSDNQQPEAPQNPSTENAGPPAPPEGWQYHTVAQIDTLWSLSQRYGAPIDVIATKNNIKFITDKQIGETMLVPIPPAGYVPPTAPAASTGGYTAYVREDCHGDRKRIVYCAESDAGLYLGGWSRGAGDKLPVDWAVIDLTGSQAVKGGGSVCEAKAKNESAATVFADFLDTLKPKSRPGPWLSMPVEDYKVANLSYEQLKTLAATVLKLIQDGTNVLVACTGGHGRTGMIGAILAHMVMANPANMTPDPVSWIRAVYCKKAVETDPQVDYVFEMCGLGHIPLNERPGGTSKGSSYTTYTAPSGGSSKNTQSGTGSGGVQNPLPFGAGKGKTGAKRTPDGATDDPDWETQDLVNFVCRDDILVPIIYLKDYEAGVKGKVGKGDVWMPTGPSTGGTPKKGKGKVVRFSRKG